MFRVEGRGQQLRDSVGEHANLVPVPGPWQRWEYYFFGAERSPLARAVNVYNKTVIVVFNWFPFLNHT